MIFSTGSTANDERPARRDGLPWWSALAAVLVLASCASSTSGGDGVDRIRGRVLGPSGMPLDGVRITTEPETDAVLTFDGLFEISRQVQSKSPVVPGIYVLKPYKLGWWMGPDARPIRIEYPGGDYAAPDIQLYPIVGPTMDDLTAPAQRDPGQETQGSGVIRDGE